MNKPENSRQCPDCSISLMYSNKYECARANKKHKVCYSCRTQRLLKDPEYLRKLKDGVHKFQVEYKRRGVKRTCSDAKKEKLRRNATRLYGKDNSSFGKNVYKWWLEKYGKAIADQKMDELKKRRSALSIGKNNPMYGRPSPQGSGNGWSGWYKGWYFRSIHELSYMVNVIERNKWIWESAEQKKFAIPYVDWEGKLRTYFADFVINKTTMIECKPTRLHNSPSVKSKQNGAIEFCEKNGLTYVMECPILLSKHELKILHDAGTIKFLKKYEDKYQLIYNK